MQGIGRSLLLTAVVVFAVALSGCGERGDTPTALEIEGELAAKPVNPPVQILLDQKWLAEIHKAHGHVRSWKTLELDQYESNGGVFYAVPRGWDIAELKAALAANDDELKTSPVQDITVRVPEGENRFPHDVTFYQMDRFARHEVVYITLDPHRYPEMKVGDIYLQFTLVPPIPGSPFQIENLLVKSPSKFAPGLVQVDRYGQNWPLPDREAGVIVPSGPPPVNPDD